jgi:hypothetical protein
MYKVLYVVGCGLEREELYCACPVMLRLFRMLAVYLIADSVVNTGGKVNQGVGGKMGHTYSICCDLVHILAFVG